MKASGFSLIELMVVLALMAVLALTIAPLSGAWVQNADLLEVEGDLTEAIGRAKAAALRNYPAVTHTNPVAAICISNTQKLTLLEATDAATPPDCDPETGTKLWSAQLDTDVTIQANANTVSCMCFNNRAMLTTSGTCAACVNTSTLTLDAGHEPSEISLY